jgi:hypothetical protein
MKTHRTAHAGGGGGGWGERSPHVLPELFGLPTGEKTQGRGQGGSAANFFFGPPHGPCRRVGGSGAPKCCWRGGVPSGRKIQGRRQGGSPADFLLGPQYLLISILR